MIIIIIISVVAANCLFEETPIRALVMNLRRLLKLLFVCPMKIKLLPTKSRRCVDYYFSSLLRNRNNDVDDYEDQFVFLVSID